MAESTGIRASQIKAEDRHGTDAQMQSSDGTGTTGNIPKFDANGGITDSGIAVVSVGAFVSAGAFVEEVPNGTLDGTNATFTLSFTPIAGSLTLFLNIVQREGTDFTISGPTITFAVPPKFRDTGWFQARYLPGTKTFTISGTVASSLAGVSMALTGTVTATTTTDGSGNYSFAGLSNGPYTITPTLSGQTFSPTSLSVTISGGNLTGQNFVPTGTSTFIISGTVSTNLAGVSMALTGTSTGTATTDGSGNYSFPGLANGSYTVTPTLTGYTFAPTSHSITVSGANQTGENFVPTLTSGLSVAAQIFNDMTGTNEGHPHGVPSSYDFYSGPIFGEMNSIAPNTAVLLWGDLYVGPSGNPAPNTLVEIKNMQVYWLKTSTGLWQTGLAPTAPISSQSGLYSEDFQTDYGIPIGPMRTESDGGVSIVTVAGQVAHFYLPFPRISVINTDISGFVGVIEARLVLNNPLGTDDRASASFLLGAGMDPYPSTTGPGIESNPNIAGGKFKFVTTSYRSFCITSMSSAAITANPPPVSFTGINP